MCIRYTVHHRAVWRAKWGYVAITLSVLQKSITDQGYVHDIASDLLGALYTTRDADLGSL